VRTKHLLSLESRDREQVELENQAIREIITKQQERTSNYEMKEKHLQDTVSHLEFELRRKIESQIELMNELNQASSPK
mgnify:CR=1